MPTKRKPFRVNRARKAAAMKSALTYNWVNGKRYVGARGTLKGFHFKRWEDFYYKMHVNLPRRRRNWLTWR